MVHILEIDNATQEACLIFGNIYYDLKKFMGVVQGCAPLMGEVAGKGETHLFYPFTWSYYISLT